MVKALANSPYIAAPETFTGGAVVYFDVLGLFVVSYSQWLSHLMNAAVILCVLFKIGLSVYNDCKLTLNFPSLRFFWLSLLVFCISFHVDKYFRSIRLY